MTHMCGTRGGDELKPGTEPDIIATFPVTILYIKVFQIDTVVSLFWYICVNLTTEICPQHKIRIQLFDMMLK